MPVAQIHRVGAACMVRIHGLDRNWRIAVVVCAEPLTAEIVGDDPIWKGCRLTRTDGYIRVDPRWWPKQNAQMPHVAG